MAERIGEVIRDRRQELGYTQDDLAMRVRVSKSYLSYIESSDRYPKDSVARRLALALGLDQREFLQAIQLEQFENKFGGQLDLLKTVLRRSEAQPSPKARETKDRSSAFEQLLRASKRK